MLKLFSFGFWQSSTMTYHSPPCFNTIIKSLTLLKNIHLIIISNVHSFTSWFVLFFFLILTLSASQLFLLPSPHLKYFIFYLFFFFFKSQNSPTYNMIMISYRSLYSVTMISKEFKGLLKQFFCFVSYFNIRVLY